MKKTCGLFLLGLLIATFAYFFLIRRYVPEIHIVPSIGLAVLGGFSALALFGAVSTLVQGVSDKTVIARARSGKSFVDGKRAAAIGRIHASGLSTITAPFSGRDCLAYEYEHYQIVLVRSGRTPREEKTLYTSGFGMVPSHVRTPQGEVRLLGFPLIDDFSKDFTESEEDRDRAKKYFSETTFHNVKQNIGRIFSEFDDLFQDADGAVKKDLGEPVPVDEKHHLTEIIVPSGAEVCAIGVYSRNQQGLIAKTAALPIRLVPGNAEEAGKRLHSKGSGQFALALIFFLIINGAFTFLYHSMKKERYNIPESQQWQILNSAAEARDFKKLELLFQHGIKPDATDSHSRTLLQTTRDPELMRMLLRSGANPEVQDPENLETPLFEAARNGDAERMKALLEEGANANAVSPIPWRHTPIDEAIRAGQSNAVDILLKSGVKDPRVISSNGKPVVSHGPELTVIRKYLNAIQRADKETLKSITTPRYEYFFDDVDFSVWQPSYPIDITTHEGYASDTAATIEFRGERGDREGETEWIFQLEKQPDGWKIHQTWPAGGGSNVLVWR